MWHAPSLSAVGGFALKGLTTVVGVVIPDLRYNGAVGGLDRVQFVILGRIVAGAGGDLRQLLPRFPIVL